jgi:two-component system, chemotaxis family, chemotaxis protein CheY
MSDTRMMNGIEESVCTEERRRKSRLQISTPVQIRNLASPDQNASEVTTTVNLSPTGILIETANPTYCRNMKVAVVLPYSESAEVMQGEQEGTVVRVSELPNGRRSVAISLGPEYCKEIVKSDRKAHKSESVDLPIGERESVLPLVFVLAEETAARDSIRDYLSGEGYEVVGASTLIEARSVLNGCTPALVIAEIEGEGMPGYDLCAYCKQTPRLKFVPVLLMTSSAYPSDYAKAHSSGAVVCMAKPYKRERLGHVVRLLAPPLDAHKETLPRRRGDASRRAGGNRSKSPSFVTVR